MSSTRYVEFDAPYLKQAFLAAGLKSSQFIIQNALGSDSTQFTDAQADITKGAKVLLVDPLDSTTGATIEKYAKARGVPVVDYDRLTLGGKRTYYVSFNNVTVGALLGNGLTSCLTSWKVSKPGCGDHVRGGDGQQRDVVRPGLQRRAEALPGYNVTAGSKSQTGGQGERFHRAWNLDPGDRRD